MLEETLRQIKKCRAHMQQKKKHVMDTTKSYTAAWLNVQEPSPSSANDIARPHMGMMWLH